MLRKNEVFLIKLIGQFVVVYNEIVTVQCSYIGQCQNSMAQC